MSNGNQDGDHPLAEGIPPEVKSRIGNAKDRLKTATAERDAADLPHKQEWLDRFRKEIATKKAELANLEAQYQPELARRDNLAAAVTNAQREIDQLRNEYPQAFKA
jgi:chromosome segregation ATPase